ncbi:MAG: Hsp33 family molecular chaperone [Alphaproteobacteria bacterium]|jgi:molecular chaperone Hsp33|nr:Hsp33 family molecular chaperone [Alphaproteobacteria bacterium]
MGEMPPADDLVAAFQLDQAPVTGRIVRLGPAIHEVLTRHAYPAPVANLLGEACVLAALVGSSLKMEGRLIVQAQGSGPVAYVVADYDTAGGLRGYCRFDAERVASVSGGLAWPGARTLLGDGVFIMTLDQGPPLGRHQGVTAIEGETLALCAESYFAQSEQVPTRVRLAVGETLDAAGATTWRAGGLLIQALAGDEVRAADPDGWRRAEALFATLGEDELIDPDTPADRLLYRLFHEDGVRLHTPRPLSAVCRCSEARILDMLRTFSADERSQMVEPDGQIRVTCEYCSRVYLLAPEGVG